MVSATARTKLGYRVLDIGGGIAGDASGSAFVACTDSEAHRATYGAYVNWSTFAAAPTDIFTITGSANKLVRIKSIHISGSASSATNLLVYLVRRSAANTGGAFNTLTPVRHDLSDDAPTATAGNYTANPSALGTTIGTVHGGRINLAPAANGSIDRLTFDYGWVNDKALLLNGATNVLAINLGGQSWPSGGALDIDISWVEEVVPNL